MFTQILAKQIGCIVEDSMLDHVYHADLHIVLPIKCFSCVTLSGFPSVSVHWACTSLTFIAAARRGTWGGRRPHCEDRRRGARVGEVGDSLGKSVIGLC